MLFEISTVKKARKCSQCGDTITSGAKFFIQTTWQVGVPYPMKKNVCMECGKKLCTDEFIEFVENMLSGLKKLRGSLKQNEVF